MMLFFLFISKCVISNLRAFTGICVIKPFSSYSVENSRQLTQIHLHTFHTSLGNFELNLSLLVQVKSSRSWLPNDHIEER